MFYKKKFQMELLAGGLAASGACLLTNPLEVTNSAQPTVVLVQRFFGLQIWILGSKFRFMVSDTDSTTLLKGFD
jgi:hypothetical protein